MDEFFHLNTAEYYLLKYKDQEIYNESILHNKNLDNCYCF